MLLNKNLEEEMIIFVMIVHYVRLVMNLIFGGVNG